MKIRKITLSDKFVHSFISRETKNLSSPSVPRSILFLTAERKIKIDRKEGVPLLEFSFSQIASVFSVYSFPKKWKEWIEKKVATRNVVHGWNRFDSCRAPNPRVIYPRLRNKFVINRFVYLFVVFSFPFLFLFFSFTSRCKNNRLRSRIRKKIIRRVNLWKWFACKKYLELVTRIVALQFFVQRSYRKLLFSLPILYSAKSRIVKID